MTEAYKITRRSEDSSLVDVALPSGTVILPRVPATEAAERIAAYEAKIDGRKAKIAAYEAAGMRIVRDASDMPRAARFRHMNRVAVVQGEQIIAHYASIDDVPAIEAPAEVVAAAEVATPVAAPAVTTATPVARGTITEAQATYILRLISRGAHEEGGFFAGPTDAAGVYAMSREDASLYIDSLTDRY